MIHYEVLQLRFMIEIGDDTQARNLYESSKRMGIVHSGARRSSTGLNGLLGRNGGGLCISIFGEVLQQASGSEEQTGCDQDTDEPGWYCYGLSWALRLL